MSLDILDNWANSMAHLNSLLAPWLEGVVVWALFLFTCLALVRVVEEERAARRLLLAGAAAALAMTTTEYWGLLVADRFWKQDFNLCFSLAAGVLLITAYPPETPAERELRWSQRR